MKTAKEILELENSDNKLDIEATKLAEDLIKQLTERKLESISEENVNVTRVIRFGYSYSYAEVLVRKSASILTNQGFYAQVGECETTPNGNERPMIRVWLSKPKHRISIIDTVTITLLISILIFIVTKVIIELLN